MEYKKTHLKIAEPQVTLRTPKEFTTAFSDWRLVSRLKSKSVPCDTSDTRWISIAKHKALHQVQGDPDLITVFKTYNKHCD